MITKSRRERVQDIRNRELLHPLTGPVDRTEVPEMRFVRLEQIEPRWKDRNIRILPELRFLHQFRKLQMKRLRGFESNSHMA